ncbi:unnamed protein product [Enterobius vermicularis]|uniref:Uncharacterized protein n=1 Tax=Enterobius vermicularis TaxID=51028 RepID=A0A0N4UVM1_ENTVE|nr:unnamed protein product [Enterobius vermicularis]
MTENGAGVSQVLSAAERRELRRKRILEKSQDRIDLILNGPTGTEKRNAPVVEGGRFFTTVGSQHSDIPNGTETGPAKGEFEKHFETVQLSDRKVLDKADSWAFYRIFLRLLVAFSLLRNVAIPWFVFALSMELFTLSKDEQVTPQLLFFNIFSQFGLSQSFLDKTSSFYRVSSNVMSRSLLAAFGFLSTNLIIYCMKHVLDLINL